MFLLDWKGCFSAHARQLGEEKLFGCKKVSVFSSCKTNQKMKSSFQHGQTSTFHRTQTNVQSQISSAKPHCELAVQYPIFETLQSCVCTTVTLSHRFKSSPSIPGNLAIPGTAGYMMNAGRFRNNYISTGDLNRGRRTESRVLFGYFLHDAKSDNSYSLRREIRGSANLEPAHRSDIFAPQQLKPL